MHPLVFGYAAFLVVLPFAVAAGMVVPLELARRRGVAWRRPLVLLLLVTLVALAGAKSYSILERGQIGPLRDEIGAGFRYPGGILAVLIAVPLFRALLPAGLSLAAVLDLMAPGIGIAMVVMRAHCLLTGCCTGFPCTQAWCIAYPHQSPPFQQQMLDGLVRSDAAVTLPLHPLPIYFMLASLGTALFAIWFLPRAAYAGQTFLIFLTMHEGTKFALEFVRYPAAPLVQGGSLVVAVAALATLAVVQLRRKSEAPRPLGAKAPQVRERP